MDRQQIEQAKQKAAQGTKRMSGGSGETQWVTLDDTGDLGAAKTVDEQIKRYEENQAAGEGSDIGQSGHATKQ